MFLTECIVSAAFFGSSIYMMTVNNDIKDELYNSMSDDAKEHYKKITKERVSIYIKATVTAVLLAFLVNTFYLSKEKAHSRDYFIVKRRCAVVIDFFMFS